MDPFNGDVWPTDTVTWSFATSNLPGQPDGPFEGFVAGAYQAIVERAAQEWEAISGLHLVETADSAATDIRVGVRDLLPSGAIGYTSWFSTGTGGFEPGVTVSFEDPTLVGVTASTGGDYTYNGYETGIFQTVLHEFGHALGLDHNYVDPNAIMAPTLGKINPTLDTSDVQAIQALYGPPANAAPTQPTPFLVWDVTAGVSEHQTAAPYTGPVSGLTDEWVIPASIVSHWVNVTTDSGTPCAFIHTGDGNDAIDASRSAGPNVLDAGLGSNFLTGSAQADTFFLDDRQPSDIWDTIANLGVGDAATIWGVTQAGFTISWADGQGATGYTGATLHATGGGHEISMTFAGYTVAGIASHLAVSFGTDAASGSAYMHVGMS